MKNIVLIGMPAAGKSTIGVIVAKRLGYDFVDTDLLIQKQEKKLLKDLLFEKGIEGFLSIENQVNCDLNVEQTVIAPGGSIVYCEEAMRHYREIGTILYLKVSFEEIQKRIPDTEKRGVVLKEGQTLHDLYCEREKLFEKYADYTISQEGLDLDGTIDKVLEVLKK